MTHLGITPLEVCLNRPTAQHSRIQVVQQVVGTGTVWLPPQALR